MRKLCVMFILAVLVSQQGSPALAYGEHRHEPGDAVTQASAKESSGVDAGNKICPVSGERIDEKSKATYEYNGKIYNFCCPACIEEFKKNPQKYIAKVAQELEPASKKAADSWENRTSKEMEVEDNIHQDRRGDK